jgi:hypothetical protein
LDFADAGARTVIAALGTASVSGAEARGFHGGG